MIETEIKRKISDFREIGLPSFIPRDGAIPVVKHMVSTLVGPRRVGKSFRAFQLAGDMIQEKVITSLHFVCALDFDNPILCNMQAKDLGSIQTTFLSMTPKASIKTPLLFIFDELHKIDGWEQYVVDLTRNPNWRVVVTGSSSKLLRRDIATELRGKAICSMVQPLSFREFLRFKEVSEKTDSTAGQAAIRRLFEEYLEWGAYPALVNLDNRTRELLLREYFDTMILRDILQRFNVSKPQQCIQLYSYLLSNMAKPFTLKSAYNFLRESGHATSKDSVHDYLSWAEDSLFLTYVPIFSQSRKDQERNYRKLYCVDGALGMRNSMVWDGGLSRALENLVFVHLRRTFSRINYYLTRDNRSEVDFIAVTERGKPDGAIQVCMDCSARDTLKREIEPLVTTAKYFGTKENVIVTIAQRQTIKEKGVTVRIIPAWQWLLENDG